MRLPPRNTGAGSKALQMLYSLPAFCRARADDSSEPAWTSQSQQPYVRVHLKVGAPCPMLRLRAARILLKVAEDLGTGV